MKRVKQLGAIVFELNPMWINEELTDESILAESILSAGGVHVVFEAEIKTPFITLESGDGWITEAERVALVAMWKTLGSTYTLTYEDDTTEQVRLAREKKLVFTPISEGNCEYYTCTIPLAKIL